MRLIVARTAWRSMLRWTQRALFAGAASALGYCGFVVVDAWAFQRAERLQFERMLESQITVVRQTSSIAPSKQTAVLEVKGLIGRLEIPRLGLSTIVMEGTGSAILRLAVGHIPGTALPGHAGNIGLSGHRDTFFRPLKDILRDDVISVTTLGGVYRYRVVFTSIVTPYDIDVLDPSSSEMLTLITCYPFFFVGSAPKRFIVRAERII